MFRLNLYRFKKLKDIVAIISNKSQRFLEKYSSIRAALLLLIFLYVGFVNAYNLFYISPEGRSIKITDAEIYKPQQRFFEKVDVIETEPQSSIETSNERTILKERTSTKYPQKEESTSPVQEYPESSEIVLPQRTPTSPITTPPQEQTQTFQQTLQELGAGQQKAPKPTKSLQQKIMPISISEIRQLSDNFQLFRLKDGSVIELHISESYSEVFTIYTQNGAINVAEGESQNEDLELWIARPAFKELVKTNDIPSVIKRIQSEDKISAKQKVSDWILYRKGYRSLAETLGLM